MASAPNTITTGSKEQEQCMSNDQCKVHKEQKAEIQQNW